MNEVVAVVHRTLWQQLSDIFIFCEPFTTKIRFSVWYFCHLWHGAIYTWFIKRSS